MKIHHRLKMVLAACISLGALGLIGAIGLVLSGVSLQPLVQRAGPNTLWAVVNDVCVPGQRWLGVPIVCTFVDLQHGVKDGYAVLRDVRGYDRLLVTPTQPIAGIENNLLRRAETPNYFADAWKSRSFLEESTHTILPRDSVVLAINSQFNRSQEQLHIHVGCVRAAVHKALQSHLSEVSADWAPLSVHLNGEQYLALRVSGQNLDAIDPFRILSNTLPGARGQMGLYTLAVVGATFPDSGPGFIILAADASSSAVLLPHGEDLLSQSCPRIHP